jgi:hypothetical protein
LSYRKTIDAGRLPLSRGQKLMVEYFGETYSVEVVGVGYKLLYDPENLKLRT